MDENEIQKFMELAKSYEEELMKQVSFDENEFEKAILNCKYSLNHNMFLAPVIAAAIKEQESLKHAPSETGVQTRAMTKLME